MANRKVARLCVVPQYMAMPLFASQGTLALESSSSSSRSFAMGEMRTRNISGQWQSTIRRDLAKAARTAPVALC